MQSIVFTELPFCYKSQFHDIKFEFQMTKGFKIFLFLNMKDTFKS